MLLLVTVELLQSYRLRVVVFQISQLVWFEMPLKGRGKFWKGIVNVEGMGRIKSLLYMMQTKENSS